MLRTTIQSPDRGKRPPPSAVVDAGLEQYLGQVLLGKYRVERMLGKGGMSVVYEACDIHQGHRVAVKLLKSRVADDPETLARFRREARVMSSIKHPNILDVIEFDRTPGGVPCLVTELLEGEELTEVIARERQLEIGLAATIFSQVAAAVQAAHDQGVVHRDLKPHNIFLCREKERDDFVKVFDFGISKVLGSASILTKTDVIMGTPCYMAPEQIEEGSQGIDHRTDIHAMGAVVYEMLAGAPPVGKGSIPYVRYQVVNKLPEPLRSFRPDLPEGADAAVLKALSKRKEDRHPSIEAFWREFSAALAQS
jgi:serine/threonine protein kinase